MTLAHDAVARSELWSSWHPEPVVIAGLVLAGVLYGRGLARLHSQTRWPSPVRPAHVVAFAAALLALAVALVSPVETAASSLFTAHMVQHLLLIVVAAPLLVIGRPGLVATAGLPTPPRRLLRRTRARPQVRRALDVVWHPVAVWALGAGVLWAWHLPGPYEAAVTHDAIHALEHVTLVAVAVLLWAAVLGRGRRSLTVPVAAVLLFASSLQSTALGAVLAFAQAPLYAIHEPIAPQWGLTPLQDQQIAGGLMWVPPGIVYMAVIATLLARWFAGIGEPAVAASEPATPASEPATSASEPTAGPPRSVADAVARNEPSADALPRGGRVVEVVAKEPS